MRREKSESRAELLVFRTSALVTSVEGGSWQKVPEGKKKNRRKRRACVLHQAAAASTPTPTFSESAEEGGRKSVRGGEGGGRH